MLTGASGQPASPPVTIPGPADRTSFFAEQARRRRHARWYSALAGASAAVLGIPFAMLITPAIYLVAVLALRLADIAFPVPEGVWSALLALGSLLDPDRFALATGLSALPGLAVRAGALVLPGMVFTVLVWLWLRRLFAEEAGLDVMLGRLGARTPGTGDLEERQLVNVAEEMALAAGLPPPRVRVIDTQAPNAAVLGADTGGSAIVVTRGLLDRFPRDETQAVVGHLIASAGNGDLRVALSVTSLFQAVGVVFTAFEAVMNLSQSAWRDLLALGRWTFARPGTRGAEAGAALARLLGRNIDEMRPDGVYELLLALQSDARGTRSRGRLPLIAILALPLAAIFMVVFVFVRFEVFLVRVCVIGPLLMLAYRSRRYLADATAVQLTRDPDALARALERLTIEDAAVPGAQWFSHFFIAGPEAAAERRALEHRRRLAELRRRSFLEAYRAQHRHSEEEAATGKGTWAKERAGAASHPKISRRLKRLAKMGARLPDRGLTSAWAGVRDGERREARAVGWAGRALSGVAAVVLLPMLALVLYMLGVVMAMVLGIATLFALAFTAGALWVLRLIVP